MFLKKFTIYDVINESGSGEILANSNCFEKLARAENINEFGEALKEYS